ncbi:MAG: TadA family conjugal transfer-associated ATPase [Lapillicoccus sp.]
MSVSSPEGAPVWEQIRRGRRPDPDALAVVASNDLATVGAGGAAAVREALTVSLLGAGPLEPLLTEPGITDVAVNGDGSVWADHGGGMRRVDLDLGDAAAVRRLVIRLAGLAGRRLDETAPYVDGLLPSGVRLHAVLPPIVAGGPHLTLRIPSRSPMTLEQLVERGMVPPSLAPVLRAVVHRRVAFLVSGGTGAGKTTLLGALLAQAPASERVVVVEDVRELRVDRDQLVSLEARPPNVEGAGEITLTALVRQALRMRPDRLVLGEARGPEVRELLTALNTGHEGGCGTVHANSAADVVARFEALGALAGLDAPAVHAQLVSAVDVIVHLSRGEAAGRVRREVAGLSLLTRGGDGHPVVREALSVRGGVVRRGVGWPDLCVLLGLDEQEGR